MCHLKFVTIKFSHFADILEKEVDSLDNESTKKAKHFYHACMNLSK